ncbi:hypothetical protein GCM10009647_046650 [Streptomyces sanglieri]
MVPFHAATTRFPTPRPGTAGARLNSRPRKASTGSALTLLPECGPTIRQHLLCADRVNRPKWRNPCPDLPLYILYRPLAYHSPTSLSYGHRSVPTATVLFRYPVRGR